jgi:hypothetical protein
MIDSTEMMQSLHIRLKNLFSDERSELFHLCLKNKTFAATSARAYTLKVAKFINSLA